MDLIVSDKTYKRFIRNHFQLRNTMKITYKTRQGWNPSHTVMRFVWENFPTSLISNTNVPLSLEGRRMGCQQGRCKLGTRPCA